MIQLHEFDVEQVLSLLEDLKEDKRNTVRWNALYLLGRLRKALK